eukprot:5253369-Amphidinium_carterae.2
MSRNSGEVVARCLARAAAPVDYANAFELVVRSTCADRHPSNAKRERLLLAERAEPWIYTHFGCSIHMLAQARKHVFESLAGDVVSSMIHLSLSLRTQHAWQEYVTCLKELVLQKPLIVREGSPPRGLVQRKLRLLALLYEGSNQGLKDAMRLMMVVNGDWTDSVNLEVYWDAAHGPPPSHDVLKDNICKQLLLCLVKPLWPRHRWTGFPASVRAILLPPVVHNLLPDSYTEFLKRMGQAL